jgi:glycosyltransferase involved in cell wall biosynthesis
VHLGIIGPIETENIARFIDEDIKHLPPGYRGAPFLGTLIEEFLNRGHKVSAFTTSTGISLFKKKLMQASGPNFKIYYCPMRPHSFRPKHGHIGRAIDGFLLERNCLKNAIQSANPDIIHAHWIYEFGLAAIDSTVPHVITCHDSPHKVIQYIPSLYRFIRFYMGIKCLSNAKLITVVSPYLNDEIKKYIGDTPVSIIPNPLLQIDKIPFLLNGRGQDAKKPNICMVNNGWGKLKNIESALWAFQLFRDKFPQAEMYLYGQDFGHEEKAKHWAVKKGLGKGVHFVGFLPHNELMNEISKADLLLHTSLEETFGMVLAEAMSLGVPVLGGKNSGAVPWVIGKGGMVTDIKSPIAISDTLCAMIDNNQKYNMLSYEARNSALERFAIAKIADLYEQQYEKALSLNLKKNR